MPDSIPFLIIPIAVFTYFWINPIATATFTEGVVRFFIEVYLGYKAWKIERKAEIAYRRYVRQSEKLARQEGLSSKFVKLYLQEYGEDDKKDLYNKIREDHEQKYRNFEDAMRDFLSF